MKPATEGSLLVVARPEDRAALSVFSALRRRLGMAVRIVAPDDLVLAPHWAHEVDDAGSRTEIRLADGSYIGTEIPRIVFCRLRTFGIPHFAAATREDQGYAAAEIHALLLSWLHSLPCPVINRPHAQGLAGRERSPFEWLTLAASAGLPTRGFAVTTDARRDSHAAWPAHLFLQDAVAPWAMPGTAVSRLLLRRGPAVFLEPVGPPHARALVVGDTVLGAPSAVFGEACRCLALKATCELLEVSFASTMDGSPRVIDVSHFPDLSSRSEVELVASWLATRAEGHRGAA